MQWSEVGIPGISRGRYLIQHQSGLMCNIGSFGGYVDKTAASLIFHAGAGGHGGIQGAAIEVNEDEGRRIIGTRIGTVLRIIAGHLRVDLFEEILKGITYATASMGWSNTTFTGGPMASGTLLGIEFRAVIRISPLRGDIRA